MAIALALSWGLHGLAWLGWSGIEDRGESLLSRIDFSELLMEGMLSMLLFAGALHIDLERLRHYRWSIGFLATFAVVVSTLIIGIVAYFLLGLFGFDVSWMYCLVFGALISSTDPTAVLGILRQANAPEDLELRIVGESLFNDGVAVVIFTVLLGAATGSEALTASHVGQLFLLEAGGGVVLGLLVGGLAYLLMRSIDEYSIEVLISLALMSALHSVSRRFDAPPWQNPVTVWRRQALPGIRSDASSRQAASRSWASLSLVKVRAIAIPPTRMTVCCRARL